MTERTRVPGAAHFDGDCTDILGRISGPTTYGTYAIAVSAVYNADTDRTRVEYAAAIDDDMAGA